MTSSWISNYTLSSFESIDNTQKKKKRIERENMLFPLATHPWDRLEAYDENGGGKGSHLKGTNGTFSEF